MIFRFLSLIILALTATSCASGRAVQLDVSRMVNSAQSPQALHILDNNPSAYGKRNELLYWLDKGMAAQLAGNYQESIAAFEAADRKYDDLYTHSLTQMAASWMANDYAQEYRGDDHEYVMVSLLQALNFAVLGNIDEAVVEARRVDQKLKLIAQRYKSNEPNVYKDDAFARFLSGILWQATGTDQGLNDAYIAYSQAMALYAHPPKILKENWHTAKIFMDEGRRPSDKKAEVYVFEYTGFMPVKQEDWVILPLDFTHITKFAFPRYVDRFSLVRHSLVTARRDGQEVFEDTQPVDHVGALAKQILASRRGWLLTKQGMRPLLKYGAELVAEDQLRQHGNELAADLLNIAGDVFNVVTERADLRGWQTLPDEIRVARLKLDPGTYEISVEDLNENKGLLERRPLGKLVLKAGEKRFLISRSYR